MNLQSFFLNHPRAALGFSGGVDSAYLLAEAVGLGAEVKPYFIKTVFQPAFELRDAQQLCRELGMELTVIELDILSVACVAGNPKNRCYYCKKALFTVLKERAMADGYSLLLDGTNASDDAADRPGMRALGELEVRSPLRECGLTKEVIRQRSRELGLFTWNKPAYACLATRIPTGEPLAGDLLQKVEGAEEALFHLGYSDLRVRVFHGAARLQLPIAQMNQGAEGWEAVCQALAPYFDTVLLDLKGR